MRTRASSALFSLRSISSGRLSSAAGAMTPSQAAILTSWSIAQEENGNGRLTQHALADPGRQRAHEPAAGARRHGDEIGVERLGLEQDLRGGLAEARQLRPARMAD